MGNASPWVGLLAGMIAVFIAAIYAVSCIKFKADQVVSGAAINILMLGIPVSWWRTFSFIRFNAAASERSSLLAAGDHRYRIGVLVIAIWYVIYKTPFGLRLRSVGEKPGCGCGGCERESHALLVPARGSARGIGGAYLSIGQSSLFPETRRPDAVSSRWRR